MDIVRHAKCAAYPANPYPASGAASGPQTVAAWGALTAAVTIGPVTARTPMASKAFTSSDRPRPWASMAAMTPATYLGLAPELVDHLR